jgi:Uma2 family endonuclease
MGKISLLESNMAQTMVRHRFSVDDYEQMIDFGILSENDRVELIRGEILEKMSIGERHGASVNRLNRLFNRRAGDRAIVSVQNPVRFPDSEPEPDVSLLEPRDDFYESAKPLPADVLLLVEVSDTTIDYDRDVKRPLYAEARIREYWIVNLNDDTLEVHRDSQPDGTYRDVQIVRRGQQIEVAALPGVILMLDEIL